jgi:hypothetical protein
MKEVEDDSVLVSLCKVWLEMTNPKATVEVHTSIINALNELSDKFGYTLKTYNLLALALMCR